MVHLQIHLCRRDQTPGREETIKLHLVVNTCVFYCQFFYNDQVISIRITLKDIVIVMTSHNSP